MASKKKSKLTLQEQANEILLKAEEKGVQTDFFFVTTFKRYQVQMSILTGLEKEISKHGSTISKEYVKGRKNLCINPAITEYNKTTTACNNTVSTLINIIKSLPEEDSNGTSIADVMKELMQDG